MAYFHTSGMKIGHFSPTSHKHVVYQLFVRLFSNTKTKNKPFGTIKENGCGKFDDINEQVLSSLKELGVTHIWYTGVLEHSSMTAYPVHGIHADDPRIVKGRAGSPYAIRDYYDVDPDLANNIDNRIVEFEEMISRTKKAGLLSVIDFIPNHLARCYASDKNPGKYPDFGQEDNGEMLFSPLNDFLYLPGQTFTPPADYHPLGGMKIPASQLQYVESPAKVTGNDVYSATPSSQDWFETVKLNFGVNPHPPHECCFDPIPPVWLKLLDILLYWSSKGVDGFRCDMAEMVPAEFWEWVIPCVKTHFPEVIFIAEIYKPELYLRYLEKGYFDYLYDKVSLYDTLLAVLKGHTAADAITGSTRSVEHHSEKMLSFMENHDEERLANKQSVGNALAVIPAMYVCALISKGPVMIYFGQESGTAAEENVGFAGLRQRTSIFDYCSVPEHLQWYNKGKCDGGLFTDVQRTLYNQYRTILHLAASSPAVAEGGFYDLQFINRHHQSEGYDERYIYSFIRHSSDQKLLIVVNFSQTTPYEVHLKIPQDALKHTGFSARTELNYRSLNHSDFAGKVKSEVLSRTGDRLSGLLIPMPPMSANVIELY